MAATAAQKATFRRMVAEPMTTTYSDVLIAAFIEGRPVPDPRGVSPWQWDFTTDPPTREANDSWVPTYDLNMAAADVWDEKAAAVACDYATNTDGANLSRNQVFEQYTRLAQRYRSRRVPGVQGFIRVERIRTDEGSIMEMTPIVDQIATSEALNS